MAEVPVPHMAESSELPLGEDGKHTKDTCKP